MGGGDASRRGISGGLLLAGEYLSFSSLPCLLGFLDLCSRTM
jgi:hypothetical protein